MRNLRHTTSFRKE